MSALEVGQVGWIDLTVENADEVSQFYQAVVGFKRSSVPVGDYEDYCIAPKDSEEPFAGICHKRGPNAEIPSCWLIYFTVANLDESVAECKSRGGKIVCPIRDMGGYGRMCVIADPAGAMSAIIEPKS